MPHAPWTPSDDLLEDVARALRSTDALGHTSWLDVVGREVLVLTFDPHLEQLDDEDEAPGWQRDERELGRRVLAEPERYHRIEPTGSPGRLHAFIRSVRGEGLRDALLDAARGGRGAYRRVRSALQRRGLEHLWQDFEIQADRELAQRWLRSNGLLPQDGQDA